jgi:hypothetical protein
MTPVLVGSNPGLVWRDDQGEPIAAVSIWDVEWSRHGSGRCLVYWPGGAEVHAFGTSRHLATHLWDAFTRHFPEFRWAGPRELRFHEGDVAIELGPERVSATAGPEPALHVEMYGAGSDPRPVRVVEFPLGDRHLELRNVLFGVDGHRLETTLPTPADGADWHGFIALAEVWIG